MIVTSSSVCYAVDARRVFIHRVHTQDELMFVRAGSLEKIIDQVSEKVLGWATESGLREETSSVEEEEALEVARL